jgi:hypothetical protein
MNIIAMPILDMLGAFAGFIFTIMVFSYIFGDNALFRLAIYIFIGVSAGYAAVIAVYNVILPQIIAPLLSGDLSALQLAIPTMLCALLLFTKLSPRFNILGVPVLAYLVGVGAAAVIAGAVLGTLFPQITASTNVFDIHGFLVGAFVIFGTLVTLAYFHFGAQPGFGGKMQRSPWIEIIAIFGKGFIAVTLGVLFAGVYSAALTALIERLDFIVQFGISLIPFQ